jgi:hypothetical protein
VFALAGCDQGRQTPAKVAVRVANAAPSFVELGFQREQDINNIASLPFKEATQFAYDVDTDDVFVIERSGPETAGRTWTFAPTLEAGNGYTVVLSVVAGSIETVVGLRGPPAAAVGQVGALLAA